MITLKDIEFQYENNFKQAESSYKTPNEHIFTLKVDSIKLNKGQSLAITGISGSGKSTLLKLLSGELSIQSGEISILDKHLHSMSASELRSFRLSNLGMIFQDSPLLEYLSVKDNILLPASITSNKKLLDISELTTICGIEHLLNRYPLKISEGERQRASICRALISLPKLVLADEPTSSLDPVKSLEITDLLIKSCKKYNCSLIMITHDHSLLKNFDKTVDINDLRGNHA